MRLPEHLELLVSDEPVMDLYAHGPWRVPDGLYDEIRGRIDAFVADPRCAPLTTGHHGMMKNPAPLIAAELISVLAYLPGAGAVYSGPYTKLYHELFGRFMSTPLDPKKLGSWSGLAGEFRPFEWLEDCRDQELALTLARESLGVFAGLEPFERRCQAIAKLYGDPPDGDWLGLSAERRRDLWTAKADDGVLEALPELHGPIGYLEWVCSGLLPVHEHLREIAPHGEDADQLLVHLLLQAGKSQVPAELAVVLTEDRYAELLGRFEDRRGSFKADAWSVDEWAWLARGLGAGAIDVCRGWLDMAVRFTAAVQGLPGVPARPDPVWVPVAGFEEDVRRLFTPRRRIVNPLAAGLGAGTGTGHGTGLSTGGSRPRSVRPRVKVETDLVGQPEVVAALEEIASGPGPVRLMIVGPDGTGKRDAAQEIVRLVQRHGLADPPLWLAGDFFAAKEVSAATVHLHNDARDSAGVRLMVIDGLDDMSKDERSGEAILEQLHRALDVHDDLHVVALCEPGGDDRIREVNPGLALRFQVARTRPFTAEGYAELFNRAVQQRGARAHKRALTAAGQLLVGTPPVRNLRNARLAQRLADIVVESVRERTEPGEELVVKRPDVPASFDSPGADPMAELEALTGLGSVKQEIELLVAGAKATKMRRDAGVPVPAPPARHMVFTGNPGTAETTVARLVASVYADLGLLSSGHLVEVARADLIGSYIGQTAPRVRAAVEQALGGVLFIDEAYSLAGDSYTQEAVSTLVQLMEEYRSDLVVIAAGYEREMESFLAANSGLASRFPKRIAFPDYSDDELVQIFEHLAAAEGLRLGPGVPARLRTLIRDVPRGPAFGNGRLMRNLLDAAVAAQSERLTDSSDAAELSTLAAGDLEPAGSAAAAEGPGLYL